MSAPELTATQLEQRWLRMRQVFLNRMTAMALFMLLGFVVLATILQVQQRRQAVFLDQMCEQRRVNAIRSNDYYDGMIKIETRNKFIDDDIRQARLKLFRDAKPIVPAC